MRIHSLEQNKSIVDEFDKLNIKSQTITSYLLMVIFYEPLIFTNNYGTLNITNPESYKLSYSIYGNLLTLKYSYVIV